MSDRVYIREVGMRDGLQSIAEILPTEEKIDWLDAEHAAGVREIEVSSFVPPKLLPQLADAEAVVRHALSLPGLTVSALIPNLRGAERGLALGVHEMNFVLSVSEGHNRSNVRRSTDESIEDFRRVVQLCRDEGGDNRPRINCGLATAFGCTIEGDVDEDRVRRIASEVAAAGATSLAMRRDRKSTRLNSSHANISYAVFCLKKKNYGSRDRLGFAMAMLASTGRSIERSPYNPASRGERGTVATQRVCVMEGLFNQDNRAIDR